MNIKILDKFSFLMVETCLNVNSLVMNGIPKPEHFVQFLMVFYHSKTRPVTCLDHFIQIQKIHKSSLD
jgi:hypothetical protein